jgi:holliday junction DNA helicase RuvB
MMNERAISPETHPEETHFDQNLRPLNWEDFYGQGIVKKNLKILIEAAQKREEPLEHLLFYGPPGLGKTTLSGIIAQAMRVNLKITSGPAIERQGDLAAILTNLHKGDILFIDEIHRLNRVVEEILYPAMEDYALDLIIGKGPGARNIRLKLPRFTILGATTRLALIAPPLRDRFGAVYRLEFYTPTELEQVILRSAGILRVPIRDDGAKEIAARSRGTARIANRLLKRVRDFAEVRAAGFITRQVAAEALALLDVDNLGLDDLDRKVLKTIIEKYEGGPVGLETIAASLSEDSNTITDVIEPYLLQLGFLDRTPRGRIATRRAYAHLDIPYPENVSPEQPSLI